MKQIVCNVTGKDNNEAWSNLLAVFVNACESRQNNDGNWPLMVGSPEGEIKTTDVIFEEPLKCQR